MLYDGIGGVSWIFCRKASSLCLKASSKQNDMFFRFRGGLLKSHGQFLIQFVVLSVITLGQLNFTPLIYHVQFWLIACIFGSWLSVFIHTDYLASLPPVLQRVKMFETLPVFHGLYRCHFMVKLFYLMLLFLPFIKQYSGLLS